RSFEHQFPLFDELSVVSREVTHQQEILAKPARPLLESAIEVADRSGDTFLPSIDQIQLMDELVAFVGRVRLLVERKLKEILVDWQVVLVKLFARFRSLGFDLIAEDALCPRYGSKLLDDPPQPPSFETLKERIEMFRLSGKVDLLPEIPIDREDAGCAVKHNDVIENFSSRFARHLGKGLVCRRICFAIRGLGYRFELLNGLIDVTSPIAAQEPRRAILGR